jgi:hypothetical protein
MDCSLGKTAPEKSITYNTNVISVSIYGSINNPLFYKILLKSGLFSNVLNAGSLKKRNIRFVRCDSVNIAGVEKYKHSV